VQGLNSAPEIEPLTIVLLREPMKDMLDVRLIYEPEIHLASSPKPFFG